MADLRDGSTIGGALILGKGAPDNNVGKVVGNKIVPSSITDDGSNVTITNPISLNGGVAVNNATGVSMANVSNGSLTWAGTTAGSLSGNVYNYTASLSVVPTALTTGMRVTFKAHATGGTSATLNLNSLGAKNIYKPDGTAVVLKTNNVYTVVYDGSAFISQGEGGGEYGNAIASDVRVGKTIGTENGLVTGTATLVVTPNEGSNLWVNAAGPYTSNSSTPPNGDVILVIKPGTLGGTSVRFKGTLAATGGTNGTRVDMYYNGFSSAAAYVGSSPNSFDVNTTIPYDGLEIRLYTTNSATTATLTNIQILSNVPSVIDNMVPAGETAASKTNIMSGKTAYVNGVKVTGTLPDYSAGDVESDAVSIAEGMVKLRIPTTAVYGWNHGLYYNSASISAANILKGKNIVGLVGTATGDATAVAADVKSGKTFYSNGVKLTGTASIYKEIYVGGYYGGHGYSFNINYNLANFNKLTTLTIMDTLAPYTIYATAVRNYDNNGYNILSNGFTIVDNPGNLSMTITNNSGATKYWTVVYTGYYNL